MVNTVSRNKVLTEHHTLIVAPEAPRCGSKSHKFAECMWFGLEGSSKGLIYFLMS